MAAPLYEAFMGKPAPEAVSCPDCRKTFPDLPHLHDHMAAQMQKGLGHLHCKECKQYFLQLDELIAHVKEEHIKPTDLVCPGCFKHYDSIGSIALHIEKSLCPIITMKRLDEVRAKKIEFAKELQKRHRGDFVDPDGKKSTVTGSHLRPKAEETVRPDPVQLLVHERGKLGEELPSYYGQPTPPRPVKTKDSKNRTTPTQQTKGQADVASQQKASLLDSFEPAKTDDLGPSLQALLSKGTDGIYTNPWIEEKSIRDPDWVDIIPVCAPSAPEPEPVEMPQKEAKKPKSQTFTSTPKANVQWNSGLTGAAESFNSFAALHNPKNPGWNIKHYLNPVLLQYKCPAPNCFKYFKKTGQFQNHLLWHLQDTPCEYQCPGCNRMFTSLCSLLFHTESKSQRCHYRNSVSYNVFINQALGGLVDIVTEHGVAGEKILEFAVPVQAFDDFAPPGRVGRSTVTKMVTSAQTTAWLGNKRNGQERSPVRLPNIPGLAAANVKLKFESYKAGNVDIDDAFKNLPELGDKIAPEPDFTDGTPRQVKTNAGPHANKWAVKEAKVASADDLVTFSDDDAKTRVGTNDEVSRGRTKVVKRDDNSKMETKLNALFDDGRKVEPLAKVDSVETRLPQAKRDLTHIERLILKAKPSPKNHGKNDKFSGTPHDDDDDFPRRSMAPKAHRKKSAEPKTSLCSSWRCQVSTPARL